MTKKYRRKGGQGLDKQSSFDPPQVFTMDRDIESQIPISKGDLRYSDSGDLIPPPPPMYRKVLQNAHPVPLEPQLDEIDVPFGERTFVGPQQKTSVRLLKHDIESPLQNNQEFSGLDKDSGYGIYDDQFDGGKRRKTKKRIRNNKKKTNKKRRKSNRKR